MLNNFLKWETSQDPTVNTIPPVDWWSPAYPPLQSLDSGPPYNLSRSLRQEWDSVRDGECDSVCKACVHHVLTCTVRIGPCTLFRRGKKVIWPNSNLFSFLTKNDTGSKSSEWLICLTWVCTFFSCLVAFVRTRTPRRKIRVSRSTTPVSKTSNRRRSKWDVRQETCMRRLCLASDWPVIGLFMPFALSILHSKL